MGAFPFQLNNTNIVLVPKGDHPETIKDLRPISLCNVAYKIISKVLANRLRPLIGKFISSEQAASVPLAPSQTKLYPHLKLDISKAFDSVNRKYLQVVLKKMGFCDH